jgi:tetratricopeptide (TPR) repeat protein
MENVEAQEFSIKPAIEKQPFQDEPTRQFFSKWCEVNDSIVPKYVSREEWEDRKKDGLLQKQNEGKKQDLFIPEDLKLWEMVDVIEAVDKDTYAHNPGKMRDKRKELGELGDMFVNAGIYLAQRRDGVQEGKETAIETAKDLYRYGNALRTGDYGEQTPIEEIADNVISPRQTEQIDQWFGGDKKVALRRQSEAMDQWMREGRPKTKEEKPKPIIPKVEVSEDTLEQTRQEMLAQFFKVTKEAKTSEPHRKALEKANKRILEKPINRPDRELQDAIFRRGLEKIVNEMGKDGWRDAVAEGFKEAGFDLEEQKKNLREILEIPRVKTELALVRETGDIEKISEKEREVALRIQEGVVNIPYLKKSDGEPDMDGSYPSKIVEGQSMICVGATLVGGELLKDVGITYLVAGMPGHSLTFLITSDEKVYLQDFLDPKLKYEVDDSVIRPVRKGEKSITTKDIVAYSASAGDSSLLFALRSNPSETGKDVVFNTSLPEKGDQVQVLNNFGGDLLNSGEVDLAMEFFKRGVAIDKNDFTIHTGLAAGYSRLGEKGRAIEERKIAIELDPNDIKQYEYLTNLLIQEGREAEASEYLHRAIELNPENGKHFADLGFVMRNLDKPEEALEAYDKAAALDPKDSYTHLMRGRILSDLDRKEEAVEALHMVLDLHKEDEDNWTAEMAKTELDLVNKEIAFEKMQREAEKNR